MASRVESPQMRKIVTGSLEKKMDEREGLGSMYDGGDRRRHDSDRAAHDSTTRCMVATRTTAAAAAAAVTVAVAVAVVVVVVKKKLVWSVWIESGVETPELAGGAISRDIRSFLATMITAPPRPYTTTALASSPRSHHQTMA